MDMETRTANTEIELLLDAARIYIEDANIAMMFDDLEAVERLQSLAKASVELARVKVSHLND